MNEALSGHVEAVLDRVGDDTWPATWKLYRHETESVVSRVLSRFNLDEESKSKMLSSLENYARGLDV